MTLDHLLGEDRGFWKYYAPGKWFRQAKVTGKINNNKPIMLLDSGAEVSILDIAFARKVGCHVDRSQSQECVGIGENAYLSEGLTRIKITLAGSLVYFFDIWVGDLVGPRSDPEDGFYDTGGIRLDLSEAKLCLPDEIRIQLNGRCPQCPIVAVGEGGRIDPGESIELSVKLRARAAGEKLWATRGDKWVPTLIHGPGVTRYLQNLNIGDRTINLTRSTDVGMWLPADRVPHDCAFA
ncbi:hypothetical protein PI125_g13342 [Phytophthora idaei]|nr:hypothetical protein PI125_g13342 [Phytophthora idaei]